MLGDAPADGAGAHTAVTVLNTAAGQCANAGATGALSATAVTAAGAGATDPSATLAVGAGADTALLVGGA